MSLPTSFTSPPDSEGPGARAAGWPELFIALKAGLPHAAEIVAALDLHGFTYPKPPAFSTQVELSSYRMVHRAWRAGLLVHLLTALGAWRAPEGPLRPAARRPELHEALYDFLRLHRSIDPQRLGTWLGGQSLDLIAPVEPAITPDAIRQRLEAAWGARGP